jgi:hypothetical protein
LKTRIKQSLWKTGKARVIISLGPWARGTFPLSPFAGRIIDKDNNITVLPAGNYIDEAEIVRNAVYNKKLFFEKAAITQINIDVLRELEDKLDHHFEYSNLRRIILDSQNCRR